MLMEVVVKKMTREREDNEVVDTKKRKVSSCDGDSKISTTVACVRSCSENTSFAPATSENAGICEPVDVSSNFDEALASCCSSNGSSDVTKRSSKLLDLDDCVETATSNSNLNFLQSSREMMISSELTVELHKLETTPMKSENAKSRHRLTTEKMPSECELDEFFAVAEKDLLKQFAEKYNFDFVKEKPLEGHYEWLRQSN